MNKVNINNLMIVNKQLENIIKVNNEQISHVRSNNIGLLNELNEKNNRINQIQHELNEKNNRINQIQHELNEKNNRNKIEDERIINIVKNNPNIEIHGSFLCHN